MIEKFKSVTSHALDIPPPLVTNCHTFSDHPTPSSVRDVLYGRPIPVTRHESLKAWHTWFMFIRPAVLNLL